MRDFEILTTAFMVHYNMTMKLIYWLRTDFIAVLGMVGTLEDLYN